ncbi:hypothetical protein ACFQ4O_14460 [Methylopila musalis]|uniref:Uncharacterized protein n=1 Tax=Methylopila musalis TaxID=1134781 RepID=A0ABW3ZB75_9HYPH
MTVRLLRAGLLAAGALLCGPALGEPTRDEATGLTLEPPPGYEVHRSDAGQRYAAAFDIRKPDPSEPGCRVGFQESPQNAGLTQDQINAFTAKKEWNDLIRATLALYYDVVSVEPFEQAGLAGAAVVGDIKPAEGQPPANVNARSYFVLLDTPRGRTTVVCVTAKEQFDRRRAEFEAVARSVQPPR